MELDVLRPQRNRGQGRRPDNRKCYSYGKEGHIARNCRSKDKVQRSQLNIIQNLPMTASLVRSDDTDVSSWDEIDPAEFENATLDWDNSEAINFKQKDPKRPEPRSVKTREITNDARCYPMDPRNQRHTSMHWTACYEDSCYIHASSKTGWTPKKPRHLKCNVNYWNACRDDKCPNHLYDKRQHQCFPGHTISWHTWLKNNAKDNNGYCHQGDIPGQLEEESGTPMWQRCLVDGCKTHQTEKNKYGFPATALSLNSINDTYKDRGYAIYMAIPVWINQTQVIALIDTGAARSFISREVVRRAGIPT